MPKEITAYCPRERTERRFRRVDEGVALIGRYQCLGCDDIYFEPSLYREEKKDLVDLIREKLGK